MYVCNFTYTDTGIFSAQALIVLGGSRDAATQRLALQALELLALESCETVCAQVELLDLLLNIPLHSPDSDTGFLVAKLLLYFAESEQVIFVRFKLKPRLLFIS